MAKEKYISLKEAAEVSGYTADYVGQLIRSGKLPGKQVISHVAWMTTEESLRDYIDKNKKGGTLPAQRGIAKYFSTTDPVKIYEAVIKGTIVIMVLFIVFLAYILSVSIDRHIDSAYQKKIEHI